MTESPVTTPIRLTSVLRVIREAAYIGAFTPSYEVIAQSVGITRWTAMQCVDELARRRMITIIATTGGYNRVYQVNPTGERTVKASQRNIKHCRRKSEPPASVLDGSARLLKSIAAYHHKQGRPGWERLL